LLKRHRYKIVYEEGEIGDVYLNESETLKSMGLELSAEEGVTAEENIKYELIDFIRGKATDMVIFIKYRLLTNKIEVTPYIRLKGTYDFPIFDKAIANRLFTAIRRVNYRFDKTNRANRRHREDKLLDFFESLPGDTLADILKNQIVQKNEVKSDDR